MMPRGALHWLGPPRVVVEGQPARLETRKVTALLAFLSVDRRRHSRERIAAMLWPEFDSVRAPANLRRTLASLQSSLEPGWINVDRETIEFQSSDDIRVDFNDLVAEVRALRGRSGEGSSGLSAEDVDKLAATMDLYQGDFLEGFNLKDCSQFDQWQTLMRDELLQHASWAFERLVEFESDSGRWSAGIEYAQRWLAVDNLNERAHRALMFLFARSGDRSSALRQYETCARLLHAELGEEPDEQTIALAERVRQRSIDAAPQKIPARTPDAAGNKGLPSEGPLLTRLTPPVLRPTRVDRPGLFRLLDEGLRRPVTLISAPAGFGKTTLVAEWAAQSGVQVAWISIEESDSAPPRLFGAIAKAVARFGSRTGEEAAEMLRSMQAPPMALVVESIVKDIARREGVRALVLDDFHRVHDAESQKLLSQFVGQMPHDCHLFISTRVDPALPLARLRARDQLVEIRADQLRFTSDETATFLGEVMELDLTAEEVTALEHRTEGWAAGLQMAALSLRGKQNPGEYIKGFEGSHRFVMDYLLGEVLENLEGEEQRFLLMTSILNRFCADLCDAVVGGGSSQTTIEQVERENLFLVPLDDRRWWYRYHHLFSELLRHRLKQVRDAAEIAHLHQLAGEWYEANADDEEAMHHYLSGRHFGRALDLMDRRHETLLVIGCLGMLLDWTRRIPTEAILDSAGGCVTVGSLYAWAGQAQEAQQYLARADDVVTRDETSMAAAEARDLRGRIATMRAFLADVAGRYEDAAALAQAADELLDGRIRIVRTLVPYIIGKMRRYQGDLSSAEKYTLEHLRMAMAAENSWAVAGAVHELVWICRFRGKLRELERALDYLQKVPQRPGSEGPTAKILADRGELERERGDLVTAERTLQESLARVERWRLPSDLYFCYLTHSRLELSKGNAAGAEADILRADTVASESVVYSSMFPILEAERVRAWLAQGALPYALSWLETYPAAQEPSPVNRELLLIARARVLTAAGRHEEALELLQSLGRDAEAGGRQGRLLEIRVLQARALHEQRRDAEALAAIGGALELAEPEGYVQLFRDEGQPVADLLEEYAARAATSAPSSALYARRIVGGGRE